MIISRINTKFFLSLKYKAPRMMLTNATIGTNMENTLPEKSIIRIGISNIILPKMIEMTVGIP